ncbi:MAG: hypothetical protein JXA57_17830 [Armatimonadetes bacterium]|nr:hypothetical protein [Armatimonadota bacterium]
MSVGLYILGAVLVVVALWMVVDVSTSMRKGWLDWSYLLFGAPLFLGTATALFILAGRV